MRKMIYVLLGVLLVLSGCGKEMEEPQFVCTTMHQEFLENGEVTGTTDYYASLNDQGLVTEVEDYTDGVLTFRSVYEYDEFGNVVRITEEKDDNFSTTEFKNTLDDQGRILRQEVWIGDTMTSFEEHSYDRKGNETRHHSNHWNEVTKETDWRTYTMAYDRKGNLARKELHWNFNDEYIVWEYTDGLCIRQTSYQEETGQVTEFWEYTYDEKDRCIRAAKYGTTGETEMYRENVYDDDARTMTSTPYHTDGMLHETYDVYHYDEYGNEILRERFQDGEVYWRIQNTYTLLETTAERN